MLVCRCKNLTLIHRHMRGLMETMYDEALCTWSAVMCLHFSSDSERALNFQSLKRHRITGFILVSLNYRGLLSVIVRSRSHSPLHKLCRNPTSSVCYVSQATSCCYGFSTYVTKKCAVRVCYDNEECRS